MGKGRWSWWQRSDYQGLTPELFHQHKARLLAADREQLPALVDDIVKKPSQPLDLSNLRIHDQPQPSTFNKAKQLSAAWISIPSPTSPLLVDIGPPVTTTSTLNSDKTVDLVVRVVQADKALSKDAYLKVISARENILLVPEPKAHGREYMRCLECLVNLVAPIIVNSSPTTAETKRILVLPGQSSDITTPTTRTVSAAQSDSTASPLSDSELRDARKVIIPLLLTLLCTFPGLSTDQAFTPSSAATVEQNGPSTKFHVDKATIAQHLHSLITLWPDSNPSRASLKRVNELLMGEVKRT